MVRVNFLVATAVGITSLLVGAGVTAAVEPKFDIEVPYGFAGPLSCKDTRLFAVDRMTMTRLFSSDGGQTWKKVGPLVDSKGLRCVTSNDAVVNLNHRQLYDRLIYFFDGLSVQRNVLILILHMTSHGCQQIGVLDGPGREVIVGSVRVFFTVQIEVQDQSM